MESPTDPRLQSPVFPEQQPPATVAQLTELSSLLSGLEEADACRKTEQEHQGQLAAARLGIAGGLFHALQSKHAPTAAHSLRVALGCSSWAQELQLSAPECETIEIAALLHDVGKIGVPDHVLGKPGKLSGEELLFMERHRKIGRQILSGFCDSQVLLETISYIPAWFDGTRHGFDRGGLELPHGSRIIAVVDAFDAMTTDHVYRRAMSRERAIAELFQFAGTQFDPELVEHFAACLSENGMPFGGTVARRWLHEIQPEQANGLWTRGQVEALDESPSEDNGFHAQLVDRMQHGVIFIDGLLKVKLWNRSAERLTGIAGASVIDKLWCPGLVGLHDERTREVPDEECPVHYVLNTAETGGGRYQIDGRDGRSVTVDMTIHPVVAHDGTVRGVSMLLHDASSQVTLEQRVQTLHEKATKDPLTKCANRAEFDRVLPLFTATHIKQGIPCSMIICDIDHFKKINDTYGHQAGDEALVSFGAQLRAHARTGDLVARYGGEEFVILCADCDNSTATRRAEEIRRAAEAEDQPALNSQRLTASFGVTEIQAGDSPETFLRRADRALLQAKGSGRNVVVQLGTGIGPEEPAPRNRFFSWFTEGPGEQLLARSLMTSVPLNVAAEKLRGFVADQHAEIADVDGNRVTLRIDEKNAPLMRRWNDRPVPFVLELRFVDESRSADGKREGSVPRTVIHLVIRPKRQRDRRRRDAKERARQLYVSLKSYLMACEIETPRRSERANEQQHDPQIQAVLSARLQR